MLLAESLLGSSSVEANYIEDVFSTYLYTGNSTTGGTQTITNGVDLSTKGGMVWIKGRSAASNNVLFDTARGAGTTASNNQALSSNLVNAEDLAASYDFLSAFNATGFTVTQGGTTTATRGANYDSVTYASWAFRKQPKFFDVVTYTGTGANRTIAHNLGSVPGCIMIKRTDTIASWAVYHRSLANTQYMVLNTTAAAATGATYWNSTTPTSSVFSLGTSTDVNGSGYPYVAYLFAHNAGGFGASGSDNVISCGSFTTDGSGNVNVNLGYEPQYLLIKSTSAGNWLQMDSMRGFGASYTAILFPNLSSAEDNSWTPPTAGMAVNSTGFNGGSFGANVTYIYIAIRRGPMKTPTSGTSVFSPASQTVTAGSTINPGFPSDMTYCSYVAAYNTNYMNLFQDRLRGYATANTSGTYSVLCSNTTDTDTALSPGNPVLYGINNSQTNISFGTNAATGKTQVYAFRRAPGFFDVVCYTGTGTSGATVNHNLGTSPQLVITKNRNFLYGENWVVHYNNGSSIVGGYLNTTAAFANSSTAPSTDITNLTSTTYTLNTDNRRVNATNNYVAYLFATVAGVSKVFSYTGNGSSQTINCGFTGGARFVLIKRTDSTGNWTVFDSARGIVAGNDPALYLNSTAAEVTTIDAVDTDSSGFIVNQDATLNLNVNSASYIGLAIA